MLPRLPQGYAGAVPARRLSGFPLPRRGAQSSAQPGASPREGSDVGSAIVDLVGTHGAAAPTQVRAYIQSLSAALAAPKEVA